VFPFFACAASGRYRTRCLGDYQQPTNAFLPDAKHAGRVAGGVFGVHLRNPMDGPLNLLLLVGNCPDFVSSIRVSSVPPVQFLIYVSVPASPWPRHDTNHFARLPVLNRKMRPGLAGGELILQPKQHKQRSSCGCFRSSSMFTGRCRACERQFQHDMRGRRCLGLSWLDG